MPRSATWSTNVWLPDRTYRQNLAEETVVAAQRTHVTLLGDPGPRPSLPQGWEQVEFDSGHWPMFTRPAAFAALLDRMAAS